MKVVLKPYKVSSSLLKLISIRFISIEKRQFGTVDPLHFSFGIWLSSKKGLPNRSPYFAPTLTYFSEETIPIKALLIVKTREDPPPATGGALRPLNK